MLLFNRWWTFDPSLDAVDHDALFRTMRTGIHDRLTGARGTEWGAADLFP